MCNGAEMVVIDTAVDELKVLHEERLFDGFTSLKPNINRLIYKLDPVSWQCVAFHYLF